MARIASNGRWLMWNTVATGAYTFTRPTGVSWVNIILIGAGGGGGGGNNTVSKVGGGGGGGAVATRQAPCTANITGYIGVGGTAGATGNPGSSGGNGGDSTTTGGLNYNIVAEGGSGGAGGTSTENGEGGNGGWYDDWAGFGGKTVIRDGFAFVYVDGHDGVASMGGAGGGGGGRAQALGGSCPGFSGGDSNGGHSFSPGGAVNAVGSIPGGGGGGGDYTDNGGAGAKGYVELWYML